MTQYLASPFPIFTDIDGDPLESGYLYVGTAGLNAETNPISVYWDTALTVPAAQPIRTLNGYPSRNGAPAVMYIEQGDASLIVKNKNGSLVFSTLNITTRLDSGLLDFIQPGTGAVVTDVQTKLREFVSVKDFGAVGDGVADDRAAIQACLDYCNSTGKCVLIPNGTYKVLDSLILYDYQVIRGQGWRKTMITGALGNKSIIRTQYGEAPTYAQRTIGWDIGEFSVTNTGGVGSIGLNFGNVGYSNVINMGVYSAETGLKCTQRTYYTCFINLTIQSCFICADLQSDGGANEFVNANFGFTGAGSIGVKITSGSWKFNGGTVDTADAAAGKFFSVGQNGYANTASIQAVDVCVEGVAIGTELFHFYNNIVLSQIYGIEKRNAVGPVVFEDVADYTNVKIVSSGLADPAGYLTRLIVFTRNPQTGVIDAFLKSLEGNTLQVVNSGETGAAFLSVFALIVGGGGFTNAGLYFHTASPEGAITAAAGSLCIVNTAGGGGATGSTYKKTAGTGNTGWVAI